MAPPPPPPPLMEEIVDEILRRLSPKVPASLFRASVISKAWRRLVTDQAALCRYRQFHKVPPVLAFFQNTEGQDDPRPRFVPTITSPPPFASPDFTCQDWMVLDCRHGQVLVHTVEPLALHVWNPITGHKVEVPLPFEPNLPYNHFTGAVLCTAVGCDHLNCAGAGGPFRVVFIATATEGVEQVVTWASLYSSETASWTEAITIHPGPMMDSPDVMGPSLLLGDTLYFTLDLVDRRAFLKYHLGQNALSVVEGPTLGGRRAFLVEEGGGLGVATVEDYEVHTWSREVADGGAWVQRRSVSLGPVIPLAVGNAEMWVVGYAEGAQVAFVSANDGVSLVDLKSGNVEKITNTRSHNPVFPYTTFYTQRIGADFNG